MSRFLTKPESYRIGQCFETSIGGDPEPVNVMLVMISDGRDCKKPAACQDYINVQLVYVSGEKCGRTLTAALPYFYDPAEIIRVDTLWLETVFPIMRQLWPIRGPFVIRNSYD